MIKSKIDKSDFNNLEIGDIIKINFSPARGHEEKGFRPGLILSDPKSQKELNGIVTVVPITNSNRNFFTRINLDKSNTITKGSILMDQIKVLDLSEREYVFIERVPNEILTSCNIIFKALYEKLLDS